ncbi:LysR family transcriptional regulator [Flocculibacter collagenilyticus]|uniref:LysR family transcriptional regulator n=1 Tax=Flocculibacter collagenilyticus TaxID=2744479 RepID=UPI0018F4D222|nr:LysR family transcriptional regulator [Flocculibacter collagenilyticus]
MYVREFETIDMRTLLIFVTVCDTLNITKSAESMGLPKSTVSKEISKLEAHLNAQLLERSTRKITVTESGDVACAKARQLLSDFKALKDDIHIMEDQVQGTLRISAPPALGEFISKSVIPQFLAQFPRVTIALKLSYSFEDLFNEGIDLAFRVGQIRDDRLIARQLGESTRVLVASPEYISNHASILDPNDLIHHNCIRFQYNHSDTEWSFVSTEDMRVVSVNGNFFCANVQALKQAAIQAVGIAQLPINNIQDELNSGSLVRILPSWHVPPMAINAVYRLGLNKPKKLQAFLDYLFSNQALFELGV